MEQFPDLSLTFTEAIRSKYSRISFRKGGQPEAAAVEAAKTWLHFQLHPCFKF
jgi:hypothetical protein